MTTRITFGAAAVTIAACATAPHREPLPLAPPAPPPIPSAAATEEPDAGAVPIASSAPTENVPAPSPSAEEPTAEEPRLAPSSEGTPSLSASDVLGVVRMGKPSIVRVCSARLPEGAPPHKVVLHLTIGRTGRVSSASTEGDTNVGACVAREARRWTFPASSGETRVNVPFLLQR